MALVTVEWASAFNRRVIYSLTWDDATGIVQTITVNNQTNLNVVVVAKGQERIFPPGLTTQDVTAFSLTITKATGAWTFQIGERSPA